MTRGGQGGTERQGVGLAMTAFERLEMAFRPQEVRDFGIDAHAELLEAGDATGRLLAIQLKTGQSYFREETEFGVVYRPDTEHFEYWCDHALPVVVVLCDPSRELLIWERVARDTAESTGRGQKIVVPWNQRVDVDSAGSLRDAATRIISPKRYSILRQEDVSHGAAKRYSVNVLLNESCTKAEIGAVIRQVTLEQMGSRYYRDVRVEERWGDVDAHVVWTFVYSSYEESKQANWICRSCWIDSQLPPEFRPSAFEGDNIGHSIVVDWSKYHDELAKVVAAGVVSKEKYLVEADEITKLLKDHAEQLQQHVTGLDQGQISAAEFNEHLEVLEPDVTMTAEFASSLGVAPLECRELDSRLQEAAAMAGNVVLPFTEHGRKTWTHDVAIRLARDALAGLQRDLARVRFEREKV